MRKAIFVVFFILATTSCSSLSKKWNIGYNDLALYIHKEHPIYDIHYEYGMFKGPWNSLKKPYDPVSGGTFYVPRSCSPRSDQLLPEEIYLSWRLKPYDRLIEYRIKIYPLVEKYGISALRFTTFTAEINGEHLNVYFENGTYKTNRNVLIYQK